MPAKRKPRNTRPAAEALLPRDGVDMREMIRAESDLAHAFACDGAYHTAGQILMRLALTIKAHAVDVDAMFERMTKGGK